jgi:crotonobetainyl-CoA:carnitine CoA-transferase CaiB-like acyl-CoA transferase
LDPAPLAGIRVVDLSRLLPGPYCTWILASLGAEVIRIESPSGNDYTRLLPPVVEGTGIFFASLHRGKSSVALDTQHPMGQEALRVLLGTADVLVEGFKPGTLARAGLAPETLREQFPELVIASITGFGQTGPMAQEPGHDINYLGYAGVVTALGAPEFPYAVQVADIAGGALMAAVGICAALTGRARTGEGRWLDISMTEGALALHMPHVATALAEKRDLAPGGEMLTGAYGGYRTYRCSDGQLLTFGPLEPKFWMAFLQKIQQPDLAADPAELGALFATQPRDTWVRLLQGCCVGPALRTRELPHHPLFASRNSFETVLGVPMPKSPFRWGGPPLVPELGRDTEAILSALGLPVQDLIASGVAATPSTASP